MTKINLELKHYCRDFRRVRALIRKIGAKKVMTKRQKDFFFNLPSRKGAVKQRMKFRVADDEQTLIHYVRPNFSKHAATRSELVLYFARDAHLLPFLKKALGVSSIVEKRRELWQLGNAVFHLDRVKGVGNIFEIELQKSGSVTAKDKKLFARYQKLFAPHLGRVVKGSNGDLLAKRH